MMECIAHPRRPKSEWRQALVVLHPDLFIFQCIRFANFACDVPGEGIDLAALFYILHDDRQVGFIAQQRLQSPVNSHQLLKKFLIIFDIPQIMGVICVQV